MWNFRTEIEDRWSYVGAWDRGWTQPDELESAVLPSII